MSRYDLTDFEWRVIEPLLPNKPRGVPRVDDRRVLNGIFWVLRSGAQWRDLPERYGPAPPATIASCDGDAPTLSLRMSLALGLIRTRWLSRNSDAPRFE